MVDSRNVFVHPGAESDSHSPGDGEAEEVALSIQHSAFSPRRVISEHPGGDNRHGSLISDRGIFMRGEGVRAPMKDFRDLIVWRKAHSLTLDCYRATNVFPKCELYGITSQMRRSAASISANIAEGCGKRGNPEFQRFLGIASGSASELEYHILLSRDLGLMREAEYETLNSGVSEVKRMLASLIRTVGAERLVG